MSSSLRPSTARRIGKCVQRLAVSGGQLAGAVFSVVTDSTPETGVVPRRGGRGWIVFRFHLSLRKVWWRINCSLISFLSHTESTEFTDFFLCHATLALELTQLTRVEPTETLLSPTLTPRQQNQRRLRWPPLTLSP